MAKNDNFAVWFCSKNSKTPFCCFADFFKFSSSFNASIPSLILTKLKPVKRKETISIPYIKKCLREILEKSKKNEDISKAYLFGSYARGEETSLSDVDIRLEVNDNFTLFDLTEIAYNLEEKLNKKVDIITSGNLDELLYEEIKKDDGPRSTSGVPIPVMEESLMPMVLELFAKIKRIFNSMQKLQTKRLENLFTSKIITNLAFVSKYM
mgnify:CR=1 FL=1